MPFDITEQRSLKQLHTAIDNARERLSPFREARNDAVREYVGSQYGENGADAEVPINLIELMVNVFTRQLAPQMPRALITTRHTELKPYAYTLQLATDYLLEHVQFVRTLRQCIKDALFGPMGICRIGLDRGDIPGFMYGEPMPYACRVDFDDWVMDMSAKTWKEVTFAGNKFRLPLEEIQQSQLYDPEVASQLKPSIKQQYDDDGIEKIEVISQGFTGQYADDDEIMEYHELWDIWLPYQRQLVTISVDQQNLAPLRIMDWEGPMHGPYHLLGFSDVPGQILPLSPVLTNWPLHDLVNSIWRKLSDQAERQKTIGYGMMQMKDDSERIVDADDGHFVALSSPQGIGQMRFGGIDQQNLAFGIHAKNQFNEMAGNIHALGGLGAQEETLGQTQIVNNRAGARVQDMSDLTSDFSQGIMRDLAWYLFTDPLINLPLVKRVDVGAETIMLPAALRAEDRAGTWLDYNFRISPYSMQYLTPAQRLQNIVSFLQTVAVPFAADMARSGASIDVLEIARQWGDLTNMDAFSSIIRTASPDPERPDAPVGTPPPKPAQTERTYNRRSIGAPQQDQMEQQLLQSMMQAQPQQPQMSGA